jgi:hypothetical protein
MFIYKITVLPIQQVYIGLDTKEPYKESRWKTHKRESKDGKGKTALHKSMYAHGIENCLYEIIDVSKFDSVTALALSEIAYIKQYDSYKNGLNSTPGGDGLGKHDLENFSEIDLKQIREALGEHWTNYNKNIKWAGKTEEERKKLTQHLHTEEVYKQKSDTLKKYYDAHPEARKEKGEIFKKARNTNKAARDAQARAAGLKGAEKMSKKIKVLQPDNSIIEYPSKKEFQRQTKQWASTVLEKTKKGEKHNGYMAWEL